MNARGESGTVVTVGTFDGLHLGHQAILEQLVKIARERTLERVVYTFSFPPRYAAKQNTAQTPSHGFLLLPQAAKLKLLEPYVDRVEHADFVCVQALTAERFVQEVLLKHLAARAIVVGESFRFGRNREGNISLLHRLGKEQDLLVVPVPTVVIDRTPVSSTRIRALIKAGKVREAKSFLGRPPLLVGDVVAGDHLGRELGFPTANLALSPSLLRPADGIYLVQAFWPGKRSPALLYVGQRPTLKAHTRRCEVYLLVPPDRDLYGERIEIHLLQKLRDDQAFPSLEALRAQLEQDVARARSLLASCDKAVEPILA